ncbi:M20 family metallopeptidase [Denitrobaculum tricleocarpae]|nr:M20 family metallopeptidase [Denitrobaculum tricleocarpae]
MTKIATKTAQEAALTDWLAEREGEMLAFLEELVNIDSGSYDKPGVDAAGAAIAAFFAREGIACDILPLEGYGDAVRATLPTDGIGSNQPILLMGHRDTVFPKGETERRPFTIKDGIAYGPGVADMKGGLVINAFILSAFSKLGGAPAPLIALFTGDEEIGSPESKAVIKAEAGKARAVFNSEPGRPTGNIVTGRKGGIFFRCEVIGKAAHSGANHQDGVSAIEELARKIQAWHALTDYEAGHTLNVGLISGGQSVNTVAPSASCDIDLRYKDPARREEIVEAITEIADKNTLTGTSSHLTILGEFHPLTQSAEGERLIENYLASGRDVGLTMEGEFSGGCADSGLASVLGAPTICGLGPVGGKVHSPEEYLEVDSIVPRAQALALTILRMGDVR